MTVSAISVARRFVYQGVNLADPSASMSPNDVRDLYSATYPELTTAEVEAGEIENGEQVFTFRRAVGTKGG
jgi:PRTRC genetic system protein C